MKEYTVKKASEAKGFDMSKLAPVVEALVQDELATPKAYDMSEMAAALEADMDLSTPKAGSPAPVGLFAMPPFDISKSSLHQRRAKQKTARPGAQKVQYVKIDLSSNPLAQRRKKKNAAKASK